MKKLYELVQLEENNLELVLLSVKAKPVLDLIKLGFLGNESMFRLTKGEEHICTIWSANGDPVSACWRGREYPLTPPGVAKMCQGVAECIVVDFGIYIGDDPILIRSTLYQSLEDYRKSNHVFKVLCADGSSPYGVCVHLDGEFLTYFESLGVFQDFVQKHFGACNFIKQYVAPNGCVVEMYDTRKGKREPAQPEPSTVWQLSAKHSSRPKTKQNVAG